MQLMNVGHSALQSEKTGTSATKATANTRMETIAKTTLDRNGKLNTQSDIYGALILGDGLFESLCPAFS